MGGKRELRRYVSLDEGTHLTPKEILLTTAENAKNRVINAFCPISIHIDECSDNEADSDTDTDRNHAQPKSSHVTITAANDKEADPRTGISFPSQIILKTGSPVTSPSNSRRCSTNYLDVPENSDLSMVKATAVRLKLRTRTSSFMEWQAKWFDKSHDPPQFPDPAEASAVGGKEKLTEERKKKINHALDWLKTELKEMQSMDQHLARQLLSLRQDIHQLRLRRSCQQHRDLLDDVQSELEEQEELSDVLDLPSNMLHDTPLSQIGVTRMNFSARRFSTS